MYREDQPFTKVLWITNWITMSSSAPLLHLDQRAFSDLCGFWTKSWKHRKPQIPQSLPKRTNYELNNIKSFSSFLTNHQLLPF